jgi:hypothetical protein
VDPKPGGWNRRRERVVRHPLERDLRAEHVMTEPGLRCPCGSGGHLRMEISCVGRPFGLRAPVCRRVRDPPFRDSLSHRKPHGDNKGKDEREGAPHDEHDERLYQNGQVRGPPPVPGSGFRVRGSGSGFRFGVRGSGSGWNRQRLHEELFVPRAQLGLRKMRRFSQEPLQLLAPASRVREERRPVRFVESNQRSH